MYGENFRINGLSKIHVHSAVKFDPRLSIFIFLCSFPFKILTSVQEVTVVAKNASTLLAVTGVPVRPDSDLSPQTLKLVYVS